MNARAEKSGPVARLLQRHRIESRILLWFLGLLVGGFLLAKAASEIVEGDTLAVDRAILLGLRTPGVLGVPIGPRWLTEAMVDMTALGGTTVLTAIATIATGYLLVDRKPHVAVFTVAAVGGGALVSSLLKWLYARTRPDVVEHLVGINSASFPSGHAMNSAVVYLTLAVLLARTQTDRRVRIYLIAVAMALTLTVGFSRVFLGVHWPSDVMAGWTIGGIWAVLCSMVAKSLQARRTIEQPGDGGQ
jgi:undecaprenyl-diphosphatase